jgi:hypothetical protein
MLSKKIPNACLPNSCYVMPFAGATFSSLPLIDDSSTTLQYETEIVSCDLKYQYFCFGKFSIEKIYSITINMCSEIS